MFLAVIGLIAVSAHYASAQEAEEVATEAVAADASALSVQNDTPIYQAIKTKFIEGGPGFMATVVLCLIFGFWSAMHTLGWSGKIWFNRWKTIGIAYTTILMLAFLVVVLAFAFKLAPSLCCC